MHNKQAISLSGDKTGSRRISDKSRTVPKKEKHFSSNYILSTTIHEYFIYQISQIYIKAVRSLVPRIRGIQVNLKIYINNVGHCKFHKITSQVSYFVTSTKQQWPFSTELLKSSTFSKLSSKVFTTYLRINNHYENRIEKVKKTVTHEEKLSGTEET